MHIHMKFQRQALQRSMNKTEHLAHVTDLSVFLVTYIVSKGERPGLLLTTGEFQVKKKQTWDI